MDYIYPYTTALTKHNFYYFYERTHEGKTTTDSQESCCQPHCGAAHTKGNIPEAFYALQYSHNEVYFKRGTETTQEDGRT